MILSLIKVINSKHMLPSKNYRKEHMKLIQVKRETIQENRFGPKMGRLNAKVTYIKKRFLGIPVQTLHKYRETYYGEVKDCKECVLAK